MGSSTVSQAPPNLQPHISSPPLPPPIKKPYPVAAAAATVLTHCSLHQPVRRPVQRLGRAVRRSRLAQRLRQLSRSAQGRLLLPLRLVPGRRQPVRQLPAGRLPGRHHREERLHPPERRHRRDAHRLQLLGPRRLGEEELRKGGCGGGVARGNSVMPLYIFVAASVEDLVYSL